ELKNYSHLIDSFVNESQLTIGFALQDNIEQYTDHLRETRNSSRYIQESTLELIDMELSDYQSFYQDLQKRNHDFFLFILALFIAAIILGVFFAFWFSKEMTRPIDKLSHEARKVSRGEFSGEPVRITSNDELKLLGDTFNQMRVDIQELVTEIED